MEAERGRLEFYVDFGDGVEGLVVLQGCGDFEGHADAELGDHLAAVDEDAGYE